MAELLLCRFSGEHLDHFEESVVLEVNEAEMYGVGAVQYGGVLYIYVESDYDDEDGTVFTYKAAPKPVLSVDHLRLIEVETDASLN